LHREPAQETCTGSFHRKQAGTDTHAGIICRKSMAGHTGDKMDVEKIVFDTDEGSVEFFVIDDTRINGVNYILVTDSDDPEAEEVEVLILKDVSKDEEPESIYEIVEDETELKDVIPLFEESMGDVDIS